MDKTFSWIRKGSRSLATVMVIICMVISSGTGGIVMGDEAVDPVEPASTSVLSETEVQENATGSMHISSDAANAYLSMLQSGDIAFWDITGDGEAEMLIHAYEGFYVRGIDLHVYTYDNSNHQVYEILTVKEDSHPGSYDVLVTDDGYLIVSWGAAGTANYAEYVYDGKQMQLTGTGKTLVEMYEGGNTLYYIDEAPVSQDAISARFSERPGMYLMGPYRELDNPMMDFNTARQYLEQCVNAAPENNPQTVQEPMITGDGKD